MRRGTGGLLLVRTGKEWAYVLPGDGALPKSVEENLEESMERDAGRSYYIVLLQGRQCSVYTYSRELAALSLTEWSSAAASSPSSAVERDTKEASEVEDDAREAASPARRRACECATGARPTLRGARTRHARQGVEGDVEGGEEGPRTPLPRVDGEHRVLLLVFPDHRALGRGVVAGVHEQDERGRGRHRPRTPLPRVVFFSCAGRGRRVIIIHYTTS